MTEVALQEIDELLDKCTFAPGMHHSSSIMPFNGAFPDGYLVRFDGNMVEFETSHEAMSWLAAVWLKAAHKDKYR